jgi:hypothetical protein
MRANALAKTLVLLGFLAITLSARGSSGPFICIRWIEPEHDWTCQVSGYRVGLRGWRSSTEYLYGTGSLSLPFPFYGVVSGAGAFSAAAGSCFLFLFRRNPGHFDD